ncbi:MAG TPA: FkbM family methyltransferase [Gemmatimonadaceae bacterium]|nr:FkbM family methyltransferase [Gemmatimonadaceae bacterium]
MLKNVIKSVVRGFGYEVHRRPVEQASGLIEVGFGPYTIEMYPGSDMPGPHAGTHVWNGVTNGALSRLVTLAHGKYPDLAVIDIGANVGDTAAVIKAGGDVPVFCIEGDPQIFPILQRNTRRLPGTTALHALLGEHEEDVRVAFEKEGWNLTVLPQERHPGSSASRALTDATTRTVSLTTLDLGTRAMADSSRYRLLKVDTEGFDCRILRGGMQFIERVKPIITLEYNRDNTDRIGEPGLPTLLALRALGYGHVAVCDESNRLLLATSLHDEALLHDLHD